LIANRIDEPQYLRGNAQLSKAKHVD
jgi:hypothetical protein